MNKKEEQVTMVFRIRNAKIESLNCIDSEHPVVDYSYEDQRSKAIRRKYAEYKKEEWHSILYKAILNDWKVDLLVSKLDEIDQKTREVSETFDKLILVEKRQ